MRLPARVNCQGEPELAGCAAVRIGTLPAKRTGTLWSLG